MIDPRMLNALAALIQRGWTWPGGQPEIGGGIGGAQDVGSDNTVPTWTLPEYGAPAAQLPPDARYTRLGGYVPPSRQMIPTDWRRWPRDIAPGRITAAPHPNPIDWRRWLLQYAKRSHYRPNVR